MNNFHWTHSIHHDGSPLYVNIGTGKLGGTATIRLRVDRNAPVSKVFLRTCPDGEQMIVAMQPEEETAVCRWWTVAISLHMLRTGYRFLLHSDEGSYWYAGAGCTRYYPTDAADFKLLADYHAPNWVRDAVFYQIFPDRFADGDPSNNVQSGAYSYYGRPVVARQWGEQPNRATAPIEFFGGDLQGITQRLDYLAELGVNALYLNPVFLAPSNHKYDVEDYSHIDPHLGGDGALAVLRRALDERGMHLLLDIVPNHCGATHPWFRAAQADPQAPTAEFFTFRKHPNEYESWLGVASLPKLDYRSQRLREVMYEGNDAIMRFWLLEPYRIDGWRIDVANMLGRQGPSQLGHKIGRAIRRAIKAEQPEAYLLGEHFFDGTPHLGGDELDASMNYQGFMLPVLRWLAGAEVAAVWNTPWSDHSSLPTEVLAEQLQAFRAVIPWQIATQQFNLIGSHDTPRLRTMLGDDLERVKLAATLLMTYPGVPCIYYGDEIGLPGGGDPDCRRCMVWDTNQWEANLHATYRQLIALRRTSPALRWGGFHMLHAAEQTLAYLREAPEERLIIIARQANDGVHALPVRHGGLADGTLLRELFSGAEARISAGMLPLSGGPMSTQIWRIV
jgi:alpha-glucosidase